ncbi:thioesterase [Enterococcus plantarum]|uniref:thioesterase II family protein n=1 Tax=Enterococcus plantarum TaxID=1077675 RepID=UPI001A90488C|nr:alpha/beta fold hydrolase [Enterococcus plantarum]MBO0468542.1 thioesterase [Enterococcus plantarum]
MIEITAEEKKWLKSFSKENFSKKILVILPHAGGNANYYRELVQYLDSDTECFIIQYPGRQERLFDSMITSIDDYADIISQILNSYQNRQIIIFGHSMGALISYNMIVRNRNLLPSVCRIIVSCHTPPKRIELDYKIDNKEEVIDYLRNLGGVDSSILENDTMMDIIIPSVQNDLLAVKKFTMNKLIRLDIPITAILATEDFGISEEDILKWNYLTKKSFTLKKFKGNHFYMENQWEKLANFLSNQFLIKQD